jgi:hypothetical protein
MCVIGHHTALAADDLCGPLRSFVGSVNPDEMRALKFHTTWGGNFKDSEGWVMGAKRCNHFDYDPAKPVCAYLMEHGATEFAGINAKRAVECLATGVTFAGRLDLHVISLSLIYGTEDRGAIVDIALLEDDEVGGMVLSITADGY